MAVNLSPYGGVGAQFLDNAGNVLTGGKIFTYAAGTTTNQVTYTTSAGNIPHSNPIILDASGRVPSGGEIWLTDGLSYKFILRNSNDVLIATYDNISGINSNFVAFTNEQEIQTATAGQTVFNLTTTTYSPGANSLSVFVDGVNQYGPGAQYAYVETDNDTVTFVNGLHVGAQVKFTTSQLNSSGLQANAFQVSYTPPFTGSVATNVGDKLAQTVSVMDFGAVGDGVTDDTAAIRLALDYASANPCKIHFPAGVYYCPTTIFLPKGSSGFTLSGDNATLKGTAAGSGTIFETGAETYSTGGTTNWEQPEVHLHRNQIIEGFTFADCEYGLKGYNLLEGCVFRNNKAIGNVRTIIYAKRCFYLAVMNNMHRGATAGSSDDDARFWFSSFVNVEQISGNSASCTNQPVGDRGVGFRFDGGTSGLLANNNVAEACNKGLVIKGSVYGALFHGWYMEGNDRDVSIEDGNYKDGLSIDGFWFYSDEQVYAESWRSGELGKNNWFDTPATNTVDLTDNLNSAHVWAPRDVDGTLNLYGSNILPAGWTINGSCILNTQQTAYLAASGPSGARYALSSQFLGSTLIVPRYFRGRSNLRFSPVPYCDVNTATFGTAVIDTKIVYDASEAGLRFDFTVADFTTTRRLSGWVSGTTVFRNDALAQTIVASDNGGFYRLTLSGFSISSAISVAGGIRIL
jgi:hypothetical protein